MSDCCVVLHLSNLANIYDVCCVPFPTLGTAEGDRGKLDGSLPSRCSLLDPRRYKHMIIV